MTQPHDWPFEQPARGTLRPWYLTAAGYLAVLFPDGQEAQRAKQGLLQRGVLANDVRLYDAEEVLSITSRLDQERSILAKTIAAMVSDREARQRYLGNARARGLGPVAVRPDRGPRRPTGWVPRRLPLWVLALLRRQGRQRRLRQHQLTIRPRHEPPNDPAPTPAPPTQHDRRRTGSRRSRAWAASLADPLHAIYGRPARLRPITAVELRFWLSAGHRC
jgi:hypothetical protein